MVGTLWSTVAGVIWIIVMTYICYRGIEVSARIQYGLLGIELVVLIVFSIVALFKVYTHQAEGYSLMPSLSRSSSTGAGTPRWPATRSPTIPAPRRAGRP